MSKYSELKEIEDELRLGSVYEPERLVYICCLSVDSYKKLLALVESELTDLGGVNA